MNETRSSAEIRDIFLRFFEEQDHLRIPGASIVPKNDPTLLYVNSGMAPLKPYFTGEETPPRPDLCNVQPCIRTRDIDDVGDRHHLTFFEMLGSWSIDNYFKERAIELAFELLVDRLAIPKERLYATVYEGNPELNLPADEVSARAWESVGLRSDQIVFLGADNFWGPAGEHGPCGPCTEVFYDTGDEFGPAYEAGQEFDTTRRYIEIWNAGVFMEFNKLPDGSFKKLRFTSVDTGSGLERLTMTLGGHATVYETDLLRPLVDIARDQLGGSSAELSDLRVLADHLRAATFMLAEGVTPSNEGRGYIPRRLIRKAIAITARADVPRFDFGAMIAQIVDSLGPHYPVLREHQQRVTDAFSREKKDFERVINKGLERLEALCSTPPFTVPGGDVFTLFSTYGMPVELVRDIVRERGGEIDEEAFEGEFRRHQEVSRAGPAGGEEGGATRWPRKLDHVSAAAGESAATEFLGYDQLHADGAVVALYRDGEAVSGAEAGEWLEVVTDRTPFYAEAGGQSADRGVISAGDSRFSVADTQSAGSLTVHRGQLEAGVMAVGDEVRLAVDSDHRRGVMANHSATHLLHAALREVLGDHVKQAGSLVEGDRLRFDFHHTAKMSDEELEAVGRLVNQHIRGNHARTTEVTTLKAALKQGALAFFGENYGDEVRLVSFGPASSELCGGTHVGATGEIGLFRVVSEGSIASGVRRIVAVTGEAAHEQTVEQDRLLRQLAARMKVGVNDLAERVEKLLTADKKPAKAAPVQQLDAEGQAQTTPGGVRYLATVLAGDVVKVRDEAQRVAAAIAGVACLVAEDDGKARIIVAVDRSGTPACDARKLMAELAPIIGGRGGGKPQLAQGGGADVGALDQVLAELPAVIERTCG